jgi:hypothetical protein
VDDIDILYYTKCPQGDAYQKPVTASSLGGATLDIGHSIAQILGRGKPASSLFARYWSTQVFHLEYSRIIGRFEEKTRVSNDLVLAGDVHPFKAPSLRMNNPFWLFGLIS